MNEDVENNKIEIELGDVVFSFDSFMDFETLFYGNRWLSDRDLFNPFDSARILLTAAHLIESIVTKERIVFFAWDRDTPISGAPDLPFKMYPIEKTFHDFKSTLNKTDPALLRNILSASADYETYLRNLTPFDKLPQYSKARIKEIGQVLIGDMLRAQDYGIPFSPTSLESGACLFRIVRQNLARPDASSAAIRIIESARSPLAELTNERMSARLYDLRVPAVFAAATRNAKDFQDLLKVALQMRQTKEAKAFRKWAREVDNDSNLARVAESLDVVQDLSDGLAKGIEQKPREVQVQLGVSFIGSFQITIPFRLPRKRERHLTFLKSLFSESCEVESLDQEIRRVFGAPIGEAFGPLNELKRLSIQHKDAAAQQD